MAVDLGTEVKRRKIADALTNGDDDDSSEELDSTDSTEEPTEEPTDSSKESTAPEEPAAEPAAQASRREAGFVSLGDYSQTPAASPTPAPAKVTYPTIAEDQPAPDYVPSPAAVQQPQTATAVAQPEVAPEGHIDLGPPGRNIYTASDTGARYTIDPDTGQMVPHAELATAEDKAAMPPGDVGLPRAVVTSAAPVPDRLTQVERGELVGLPWHPAHPEQLAEAPSQLTQVERGQLVPRAIPVQPPDTLTQVERGQLVSVPRGTAPRAIPAQPAAGTQLPNAPVTPPPATQLPNAPLTGNQQRVQLGAPVTGELAQGPPGTQPAGTRDEPYWPKTPEQIGQLPAGSVYVDPRDGSLKTTPGEKAPGVGPMAPSTEKAPGVAQPPASARQAAGFVSLGDYSKPAVAQQPTAAQQPVTTMPNGSDFPQRVQAVGNEDPAAFIVHHTSGRGTVDGVVSTLNERGLGVQYVMDRAGNIFQTGGPGAQNILKGWGKGEGLSNQNIVGMEIIAKDDKDVTPQQAQSFARFIAARYPDTPLYGHGEVNPGHKEADEGQTAKAAALAYRSSGQVAETGAAPSAQPVTKLKNGFYQDEKPNDFITGPVTTFATPDDIASGQDNGVGSPHLGKLDTTQVAGVALPQWVLQQYFGNSTAAMRQARVDVVDPQTGKRLRVPIVDIGPGPGPENAGVISDMTPALANYFGGDKNLAIKIVPKAGPDVMKNPQLFYDEQAAIKQGFDSSALDSKRQVIGPQFATRAQTSEEATAAQQKVQAAVQKQQDIVSALPEVKGGNVIEAYQRLDQGVEGVSPAYLKNVQATLKEQAITQIRQKYPEIKSDDDAWKVAQTPAGISTLTTELGTSFYAAYTRADLAFNQMMQGADANRLTDFARALHPDYKPEGLTAFVKSITDIQDPTQRSQMIGKLMDTLPESTQSMFDAVALSDSADRIGSPAYQKAQSEALAAKRAYLDHLESPDPRLRGNWLEKGVQLVGSLPATVTMADIPGGTSLFAAQIYLDSKDKLRAQNPNWSEAQINDTAQQSTVAQLAPQALLAAVGAGQLGRVAELVEKWTGGKISFGGISRAIQGVENPALRAVIGAFPHIATGTGAGVAQQIAGNIAEGRPMGEGVLGAAFGGAVMAGPAAIGHGIGALRPGERLAAVQPPAVEPTRAEPAEPPPRPVTPADVLGLETAETTPWYQPGPIVTRAGESEAFSPAGLAEAAAGMRAGGTPEEMRQAAEQLQPAADFRNRGVFLGDAGQVELDQAMAAQARQNLYPIDRQGQPKISESEPWVSQIANRFTAERMATGELGPVAPGVGVTKEEMLARGLQMSPEQINQHVSNVMNDVGGNARDQAAAIRTEEARLSQRSHQASLASEADPKNAQLRLDADNAFKDLTDFHNGPVAKLKNNWHAQGMTLQGEVPVDLSSYNGLRDAYLRDVGKAPPDSMEPALRATAKRVRDAADAESAAIRNLGTEIERQSARRRLPTDEEVRNNIMARMKVEPCPT